MTEILPIQEGIVAEVRDIDLGVPQTEATIARLYRALTEHTVLVFRDQDLNPAQHVAFSRRFAGLEIHIKREFTLPEQPEVFVLSNIVENGRAIGVTNFAESWHSDGSHDPHPPLGALLYAIEVPPEGADTQFANMYMAYDALDDETKALIAGRRAVHSYHKLQAALYPDKPLSEEVKRRTPDRLQPIVRPHAVTGRHALFLGDEIIAGIEGMPEPDGTALMQRLLAHATDPRFVYTHRWQVGDLLMWDNRCTMHRVLPFDQQRYRRRMHRTTLAAAA